MNALLGLVSVVFVIGFIIFGFMKFLKPMMGGGGRVGMQNSYLQPIIDSYQALANQFQSPPPQVPEYQGYKAFPILTIKREQDTIIVTPVTDTYGEHERSILYRDPYVDWSNDQRMKGAAAGQAAMSVLDAVTGSSGRHHHHVDASQLTTVKLLMPQSFKGSRILIRPETLIGKLTSLGEVVISHPGFDTAFKVHGGSEAMVRQLLTPQTCDALLRFKQEFGRFLLCEDYLLWVHQTFAVDKVPPVVNALFNLAKVFTR